jgi:hypothetical protein
MHSVIVEREDGTETITIFGLGDLRIASSDHPNFAAIKAAAQSPDFNLGKLEDLFDTAKAIAKHFERLTDRVSVRGETIYLDLEPVHNALAEAILQCMKYDQDFDPLVNFMERLEANPNPKSREALYTWLDGRNFTITPEGLIIGYKGVTADFKHAEGEHADACVSKSTGHAFVDGIEYGKVDGSGRVTQSARIPYPIGSVVEMPRTEVVNDQGIECSQGLHVGTFDFARTYSSSGQMLEVHIDPRDVVSVPDSTNSSKIRVCRLTVVGEVDSKYEQLVLHPTVEEYWSDEDEESFDEADPDRPSIEEFDTMLQRARRRRPSIEEFDTMLQRARRRRQSIVPYIEAMTLKEGSPWSYSGKGDSTDRLHWKK